MLNNANTQPIAGARIASENAHVLNGWKEIASYVGRGVRTVQRWEGIGLPVRRPNGRMRSAVLASTSELSAWLAVAPQREPQGIPELQQRIAELEAENASLRHALSAAPGQPSKHNPESVRLRREG